MIRKYLLSAAALTTFTITSGTALSEPVELRINWSVAPSHITPMINEVPKSIYRNYGKTYTVKTIRMRGSGPALTALAAGEIDIAGANYQAYALGIINGKQNLKAIASVMRSVDVGVDNAFWVRKDAGINKISDLKGKRIAVNALGGGVHAAAQKMLNENGLQSGRDFQWVEVRFRAMLSAINTNRIDVAYLVLPFNFRAEKAGNLKPLFTMRQSLGPQETLLWSAKADFVAKNRQAFVDFLADHIRMRQWAYDPKNRKVAAEILAKIMRRKASAYEGWVFTDKGYGRTVDASFDPKLLQKNVDDLHKLKVIPGTFDVSKHADLSLLADAKKQLK
jgi:sulfonate transport system substrate-binding protein